MSGKKIDIEEGLILRLKKGDWKAFNSLFLLYSQRLYFFALGYLKTGKEAEEIVQETFLKVWENRENINPALSLHAYIFKIAFNFIRKSWIKKIKDDELKHNLTSEIFDFDDHTCNSLNYHSLLEYITQLIGQLPPRQKEILELRKLQGYSTKEIAKMLNLAVKTVEAHLSASLRFLRDKLKNEKFDDLILFALILKKSFNPAKGKIALRDITNKARFKYER